MTFEIVNVLWMLTFLLLVVFILKDLILNLKIRKLLKSKEEDKAVLINCLSAKEDSAGNIMILLFILSNVLVIILLVLKF